MGALKVIGKVIYLVLAIATLIAGVNVFMFDASLVVMAYLIVHSVAYLLSAPLLVSVGRGVMRRAKKKAAMAYTIAAVLALYLLAPLTLIISFVKVFASIVGRIEKRQRRVRIEYTTEERREIYHLSAATALESILDPTTAKDVVLDDGITTMTLKQVATVDCLGKKYALLAPVGEDGEARYTYAYEIRPRDGESGALTLIPVVDERTYRTVYEAYKRLITL